MNNYWLITFNFCRTIPKANYVTLGSLRFGVKPVPRGSSVYSTDEGSRDTDVSVDASSICDKNCFESSDCCCIGTSNNSADGQTIYKKDTRLPVAHSKPVGKKFLDTILFASWVLKKNVLKFRLH